MPITVGTAQNKHLIDCYSSDNILIKHKRNMLVDNYAGAVRYGR